MGYNYFEAFQEEPTPIKTESQVEEPPFATERALAFFVKLQSELANEELEVKHFVTLKVAELFYTTQLKNVSERIDLFLDQAEELVTSPDARTPEVLKQREALAKKVDVLLDFKEMYIEKLEQVESDLVNASSITKEQKARTKELLGRALDGMNQALSLPEDLN